MVLGMSKADEHSREEREDVSLNEGNEDLYEVHEEEHEAAEGVKAETHAGTHCPSEEDDAGKGEDDGVTCHHVGKETDHEGEGLGEDTNDLNDGNQRSGVGLQEERHLGPEDFLPVLFVAEDVDEKHRADGEEERDVDVTRHVSAAREDGEESEDVRRENEEEDREEIRGKLLVMFLADASADDAVMDSHGEHLHHSYESAGCFALLVALTIPSSAREEYGEHDEDYNPNLDGRLGEAQVEGALSGAVAEVLENLAVGLFVEVEALVVLAFLGCFFNGFNGGEEPLARVAATQDDGQGNADVLSLVRSNVPFVGVCKVFKYNLRDVDCCFLLLLRFLCEDGHCYDCSNEEEEYGLDTFH